MSLNNRVHLVNPKDLDKTYCGQDFREVSCRHRGMEPKTVEWFGAWGWLCKLCLKAEGQLAKPVQDLAGPEPPA